MFALNWKLALFVIAVVPPLALLTWYFQQRILRVNREARRINSQITGAFNEGITGARTSKTMVIEDQNTFEFSGHTESMYRKSSTLARLGAMYWPLILLIGSLSTAAVIQSGGGMVAAGVIEFGMLAAFINYTMGIFEPIQQIARVFTNFVAAQANIERVFALLDQEPDITDSPEVIQKYGDAFSPGRKTGNRFTATSNSAT
jgi:ATP-binding cassette subfamily B protein